MQHNIYECFLVWFSDSSVCLDAKNISKLEYIEDTYK